MANQNLNVSSTLADNDTNNGTQTLAISSGSFAIEAGNWDVDVTTDQRGFFRNNPPTIGAYEYDGFLLCHQTLLHGFFRVTEQLVFHNK